ncbi:hypothetical protein KW849_14055 [Pseudomonas sp. PDM26]|uniref:hypothetical protein n=1 Tax=Pseudomonas TaxID=286 RepID=UPI001C4638CB|nr:MULTISPECIES: hypothetical protein [Pseudomonas]MBV7547410.1 hypothetical protein [Pseudomonas sp. PDM26]MCT9824826.1 hypothetical protein [Pseudomonas veronii]
MTITAISRVTVALGYDIATNQPVIRHWIDKEEVIDTDGAHLFVMVGKKRGAISIRYKLHPLDKEDERALQGGPYSDFNRSFSKKDAMLFSPDQTKQLLQFSFAHCRIGYEQALLENMLCELRQVLLAGAAFRLSCIDELDAIPTSSNI